MIVYSTKRAECRGRTVSLGAGAWPALLGAWALLLAAGLPSLANAQIVASEKASLSQTIDGTVIQLEYSRPSLRGRVHVFGTEVPFDSLWTPGANWATTIDVNKEIELAGTAVPAGKYTVWMATRRGDWDVILDPRDKVFHVPHPARSDSQIVFTARPDTTAPLVQTLQFSFPEVRPDGAVLRLQWERTLVDLPLKVRPSRVLTTTEDEARPYLGPFRAEVAAPDDSLAFAFDLQIDHTDGYLGGDFVFSPGDSPTRIHFAPKADQVFTPVFTINGTPAQIMDDAFVEFTLGEDGLARSFEIRYGEEDTLWMSGRRIDGR